MQTNTNTNVCKQGCVYISTCGTSWGFEAGCQHVGSKANIVEGKIYIAGSNIHMVGSKIKLVQSKIRRCQEQTCHGLHVNKRLNTCL